MSRGIQATSAGLEKVKNTLNLKGFTQEYLAGLSGCTRQTLSQFLKGEKIEKRISQAICNALDLEWEEIVQIDVDKSSNQPLDLEEIVGAIRINIYGSIKTKYSSMRVLDMTQPIDLNAIYTNVNILEQITGLQRLELKELLQSFSLEDFERFSLSKPQELCIPALDAVDKYSKLMILGKPGSGKTTFLKYVALQCIEGKFKPHLIPLFVTLKTFAEDGNQLSLIDYISQLFESYDIDRKTKIKKRFWDLLDDSKTPAEFLLRKGKFLLLLDGLDEVGERDSVRILNQIQNFSNQFDKNLFAITCRIAAKEYTFDKFTEVEVADFDDVQISTFVHQWFQIKNDPIKAEKFIDKLKQELGIRELASNPLLLTLLCLVFGDSGSFPPNRSELYKEGLDVLLKKWDVSRNIERDQVYKKLSLKRKEDLLSQIALDTFDKGNYFFKQKEAERYIIQYIRNLPNANIEEELLQFDSEAVLKSIESQHGLFVERARGIYSFSHLSFHEYFTARKIVTSVNSDIAIQKVATYAMDKRWREILLLMVGMLENADLLLQSMKENIDNSLGEDRKLQDFLVWVEQKSCSLEVVHKPAALRAHYLNLAILLSRNIPIVEFRPLTHLIDTSFPVLFNDTLYQNDDLNLVLNQHPRGSFTTSLSGGVSFDRTPDFSLTGYTVQTYNHDQYLDLAINLNLAINIELTLTHTVNYGSLHTLLQNIKTQLPDIDSINLLSVYKWWQTNMGWIDQLRSVAIHHHNIGQNWQFSESQEKLLRQYYDANKLLIDCLNSDCYVSREVRELIELTLLLPISSMKRTT
jgi:transcriptional regulator with XRE-family HTH domain